MIVPRTAFCLAVVFTPWTTAGADEFRFGVQTLTVPEGFVVERVAAPPLVGRPITMDFDERGRLYVSESSGSNAKINQQLEEKPHRILRLLDSDGDGVFDKRSVFADRMMLPEGTLWFRGSLYVSAPPVIWKLTDSDDDGVAEKREKWFDGKTLTGCANDLHGPYLGRDGRIYWCKGAFAEQTHDLPGKPGWKTRASHVFRALPDGSDLEPVLTGGMDNPVDVVFTPEGERILSCTFLQHPGGGRRDGLIHAIYGGVYGKDHGVLDGHPRTGELMPPLSHLGPAAACGLHYMESEGLGADHRGSVFATLFNLRKVTRHVLRYENAALRTEDSDFLVSDSTDFHPTDVIEDADGSLLVCDTGGWYKLCCPTSQIAKPDVLGAIYRVRRADAKKLIDPRGLGFATQSAKPAELLSLIADSRPVMRKRAMEALVAAGAGVVPDLARVLSGSEQKEERLNALWTLCRIPGEAARVAARAGLSDTDPTVRHAACHVASLWRDAGAFDGLAHIVAADAPPLRRAAAEALGRLGKPAAASALFSAHREADDRVLFHSLTYAALETGNREAALAALEKGSANAKAAALYVLDQLPGGGLSAGKVIANLTSGNQRLREAALWVSARHPDWAGELGPALARQMKAGALENPAIYSQILAASSESRLLLARTALEGDLQALETVASMAAAGIPDAWVDALLGAMAKPELAAGVIPALGRVPAKHPRRRDIDSALVSHAAAKAVPSDQRLHALEAAAQLPEPLPDDSLAFLTTLMGEGGGALQRSAAARVLARAKLSAAQVNALASMVRQLGPMEINALLPVFAAASSQARVLLFNALAKSPALPSLRPELIAAIPDEEGKRDELLAVIDRGREARAARLDELAKALETADGERGHHVFHSAKAGCSACHALGYVGGDLGPDLSRIGSVRTPRDLLESIVYPNASFVRSYEPLVVKRADGGLVAGILSRQDASGVTLALAPGATLHVPAEHVDSLEPGGVSVMPAGYDQLLSPREISDLVRFLAERK